MTILGSALPNIPLAPNFRVSVDPENPEQQVYRWCIVYSPDVKWHPEVDKTPGEQEDIAYLAGVWEGLIPNEEELRVMGIAESPRAFSTVEQAQDSLAKFLEMLSDGFADLEDDYPADDDLEPIERVLTVQSFTSVQGDQTLYGWEGSVAGTEDPDGQAKSVIVVDNSADALTISKLFVWTMFYADKWNDIKVLRDMLD